MISKTISHVVVSLYQQHPIHFSKEKQFWNSNNKFSSRITRNVSPSLNGSLRYSNVWFCLVCVQKRFPIYVKLCMGESAVYYISACCMHAFPRICNNFHENGCIRFEWRKPSNTNTSYFRLMKNFHFHVFRNINRWNSLGTFIIRNAIGNDWVR